MAKLVRRTTTTEVFEEDDDLETVDESENEDDEITDEVEVPRGGPKIPQVTPVPGRRR